MLKQNGVVGFFADKDIARYIIRAVQPRGLSPRFQRKSSTVPSE